MVGPSAVGLIAIGLALVLALTVATGFFVTQEFVYVAADRGRLRVLADSGDPAAARALRVTSQLSFVLSGSQLGITVTGLLAGYVAEPFIGRGIAGVLGSAGASAGISLSLAVTAALLLATVIQMVLGELAPKNLAIAEPERMARALAGSTLGYLAVTGGLIRVFDGAANRLLRMVGVEPVTELPQGATPEDLDGIINRSRAEGVLDADTYHLLGHGLGFRSLTAAEAMVPRVDLVTIQADQPAARIAELLDTGHTRFPVVGETVDDVLGVVSVSDVVPIEPRQRRRVAVRELVSPAVLVTMTSPISEVLELLRNERQQLACVIDEFGGLAGIITLEDIAEELVGDIRDEDDPPEPSVVRQSDGSWLVPGRWRVDEIAVDLGIALPESGVYDTISGLVMARLGRVPRVGDRVVIEVPTGVREPAPVPAGDLAVLEPRSRQRVVLSVAAVARQVPIMVLLTVGDGP